MIEQQERVGRGSDVFFTIVRLLAPKTFDPVQATKERLFMYHTTPLKIPFELMRGRVAKTKLYTLGSKASSKFQQIQRLVRSKQAKYKAYHDQKQGVKIPDIKPGDFLKIRHLDKREMRYGPPQKVISVKGSCIVLENGKKWNVESLAKVQSSKVTSSLEHTKVDSESDLTFMDLNMESQLELARPNIQEACRAPPIQDPVRQSAHERQPPPCLNDYVR